MVMFGTIATLTPKMWLELRTTCAFKDAYLIRTSIDRPDVYLQMEISYRPKAILERTVVALADDLR